MSYIIRGLESWAKSVTALEGWVESTVDVIGPGWLLESGHVKHIPHTSSQL